MALITQSEREYYEGYQLFTGDGTEDEFTLTFTPLPTAESKFRIFIDGSEVDDDLHTYDDDTGIIDFTTAPADGAIIKVQLEAVNTGNYRYISLDNIVNNFLVGYVGDGKIIDNARKFDIIFHAKRAIQEFSYDITRVEKIFEQDIPSTLVIPMPQDYVNYVKLSWIDDNGLERRIYPTSETSRPSSAILQDTDAAYLYDDDNSLLLSDNSTTIDNFEGIETNAAIGSANADDYFAQNPTYSDSIIGYGRRYGSLPEQLQVNGVFVHDEANGQFGFSSNLSGKPLTLHYVSDGLGTDAEMQIHKLAEEAVYKHIAHAILASKADVPEYIINRFRRERFAETRKAKLRLSNIKIEEITQILRGKSKQIKH